MWQLFVFLPYFSLFVDFRELCVWLMIIFVLFMSTICMAKPSIHSTQCKSIDMLMNPDKTNWKHCDSCSLTVNTANSKWVIWYEIYGYNFHTTCHRRRWHLCAPHPRDKYYRQIYRLLLLIVSDRDFPCRVFCITKIPYAHTTTTIRGSFIWDIARWGRTACHYHQRIWYI